MAAVSKTKNQDDALALLFAPSDTDLALHGQAAKPAPGPLLVPPDDPSCPRQINFTIPGNPSVQVIATENAGKIDFIVDVNNNAAITAELRGLFFHFNEAKLATLAISGGDGLISATQISANKVIDLGQGANMHGAADPFDVGIRWGTPGLSKDDINFAVHFTLSDTANDLTLDDFAHLQFGARIDAIGGPGGPRDGVSKLVGMAPAAPDAIDDAVSIFEDGAGGLNSPSKTPTAVQFLVLANDTDLDPGSVLAVEDFPVAPTHGTVAIAADGHSVLYTPFLDYSGTDSFQYCVTDGNGGQDHATVNVTIAAVADVPDLDVQVLEGGAVNEIRLIVTAAQTDADSSEYIDRILTSSLPTGVTFTPVTVDPGDEPNDIVQEFLLTLPLDTDTDFDLTFTAVSKETSNGDEQTASKSVDIVYEFNSTTTPVTFTAEDQSIWSTGDQFTFVDDRFVGIDTGPFNETAGSVFFAGISGHIKLGFQSTLTFEGGEIDATSNYDVTVETNYNKTTDQLLIDTGALLTGASFSTEGPQGSYTLDFLYDVLLNAFAGVNIDFGSIDFDPLGIIPGDQTLELGGIHETINLPEISIGPGSFNVLDLNSDTLSGTIEFPAPLDAFSVNYAWPNVTTSGTFPPNPVPADGASNNFLELDLDIDTLVTQLIGIPNVFDPPRIDLGPFFADFDLLDVDVIGGLNFLQEFRMSLGDLTGILLFEDGTNQTFAIGDSLQISNAKGKDLGGDGDGLVEFQFGVVPTATLSNETDLGFNIGGEIQLFSVEVGYDIEIPNPFGDNPHFSDSTTFGPLADFGETVPVAEIPVFDDTFALNFGQQQVFAFA